MNRASRALGEWQYLRGKSGFFIDTLRAWVLPGSAAGAFAKYLGVQSRWSLVIAAVVPVLIETAGFLLGRFLWEHGGTTREYEMALLTDPYKVKQLEYQEAALAHLAAIQRVNEEALRTFTQIVPSGADGEK